MEYTQHLTGVENCRGNIDIMRRIETNATLCCAANCGKNYIIVDDWTQDAAPMSHESPSRKIFVDLPLIV